MRKNKKLFLLQPGCFGLSTEYDRLRYATFIPSLFYAWASWSKLQIWLFCPLPAFAASNFCTNLLIFAWSNWPYKNILLHDHEKKVTNSLLLRARFPSSLHACRSIEQCAEGCFRDFLKKNPSNSLKAKTSLAKAKQVFFVIPKDEKCRALTLKYHFF